MKRYTLPFLFLLTACAAGDPASHVRTVDAYRSDDALAARTLAACSFTNAAERRVVMAKPACAAAYQAERERARAEWDDGVAASRRDMEALIAERAEARAARQAARQAAR